MRIEGWEQRLHAIVTGAAHVPYVLGEHDCFSVACAVVHALTGRDLWPQFMGRYRTVEEAIALIHAHGGSYIEAFSWAWGSSPIPVKLAQRGDLVARYGDDGYMHLGVCMGANSAFLGEAGVVMMRTLDSVVAWRIE